MAIMGEAKGHGKERAWSEKPSQIKNVKQNKERDVAHLTWRLRAKEGQAECKGKRGGKTQAMKSCRGKHGS